MLQCRAGDSQFRVLCEGLDHRSEGFRRHLGVTIEEEDEVSCLELTGEVVDANAAFHRVGVRYRFESWQLEAIKHFLQLKDTVHR